MTRLIEKAEEVAARPGGLSRRSFLGRMAKLSAAVTAAAAGAAAFPSKVYARVVLCCNLAFDTDCNSNYYGTNNCPTGCGSSWTWTCNYNGCPWVCGECYSCNCSFAYPLCAAGCPC